MAQNISFKWTKFARVAGPLSNQVLISLLLHIKRGRKTQSSIKCTFSNPRTSNEDKNGIVQMWTGFVAMLHIPKLQC